MSVASSNRLSTSDWMGIAEMAMIGLSAAMAVLSVILFAGAEDGGFRFHAFLFLLSSIAAVIALGSKRMKRMENEAKGIFTHDREKLVYNDSVIRYGVVATVLWGLVGFLVGLFIALQLTFPQRGMLDRFDSVLFVAPLVYYYLRFLVV